VEFSSDLKAIQMNHAHKTCLVLVLLAAASLGHAQDRSSDPLQGIVRCIGDGDFHAESRDRLPATVTARTVETGRGPMLVTTADGYRMMMHRAGKEPLVNLKIERSAAGKFDVDRKAIALQMEALAAESKAAPQRSTQKGIEVVALENPASGTSGVRGMVTLFDARSGTIATAYMLSQAPAAREYVNDAAYKTLQDRFVGALSACMAHSK
jgi:hypothetical protein